MLDWQWPLLLLLAPVPFLVRWLLSQREQTSGAIRVPFYHELESLNQQQEGRHVSTWLIGIATFLIWLCLLTAAARPTWIGDPVSLPQDKRDLMLAVDISGSMREADMLVSRQYVPRITAVKAVVGDFIQQRSSDRIGLILFGQQGYLQTPLTFDTRTVKQQLEEAKPGFAGQATAIGDAIGLAIKKLRDRPAQSRVLVLLTDGANTFGTDPLHAAGIAAEAKIRIHTVGVGADSKVERGFFGQIQRTNPSADLDEKTLQEVATKTGGKYFRARDPQELQQVYAEIDRLEPTPEQQTFRPVRSLTHLPLSVAIAISLIIAFCRLWFGWRNQRRQTQERQHNSQGARRRIGT